MKRFVFILLALFALPASASCFTSSTFQQLDYGLYWYGNGNTCQKFQSGVYNPYYSASKPTLIYVHGWQNGSSQNQNRETMNWKNANGPDLDLAASWLAAGYNVGILYWNQFADEGEVKDAEAKIWTHSYSRSGTTIGMRWRNSSGVYSTTLPTAIQNKNITDIFFDVYKQALNGYTGSHVRIAGHSLGHQIAVHLSRKLSDAAQAAQINSKLVPKRVVLLDAWSSNDGKSYLGNKWVGEVLRTHVSTLKSRGILFESYRSSGVASNGMVGDSNNGMHNMCAFVELKPWYFGTFDFENKHKAAVWHYLWSHSFGTPSIVGSSDIGQSASTSDSRINTLMNGTKKLVHKDGVYSKTPQDDTYEYKNR